MRADPVAKTVTGYYSLNEGALQELSAFTVPPELFNADGAGIDPALGTRVFGGIFATDRFLQGTAHFQFDYFSLTAEAGGGQTGGISWDRKSFPFSYPSSHRSWAAMASSTQQRRSATSARSSLTQNLDVVSNQVIHTLSNRLVLGITEDPASTPAAGHPVGRALRRNHRRERDVPGSRQLGHRLALRRSGLSSVRTLSRGCRARWQTTRRIRSTSARTAGSTSRRAATPAPARRTPRRPSSAPARSSRSRLRSSWPTLRRRASTARARRPKRPSGRLRAM